MSDEQPPRFAVERQAAIAQELRDRGSVEVAALAQQFGVSEDTVRRDLRTLAAQGLAQKTHGGAVAVHTTRLPVLGRVDVRAAAKAAIVARAARLVQPEQSLFVGAGSTTLGLAQRLAAADAPRPLTVITSALDVANLFADDARVRLVLAGGQWNPGTRAFEGDAAAALLAAHRADWAFVGACAVHLRAGLTAAEPGDARNVQAMLGGAAATVLLVDAAKFGAVEPCFVAPLDAVDHLVTDRADAAVQAAFRDVIVAGA